MMKHAVQYYRLALCGAVATADQKIQQLFLSE